MIVLKNLFKDANFLRFINSMQEGMVCHNAAGEIIFCNHAAEKILGQTAGQLTGTAAADAGWHCIKEDGSVITGSSMPAQTVLQTGLPQHNVIMGVVAPQHELRWISVNAQPVFTGSDKKPSGVVSSFVDITEQRTYEQETAARENYLRTLINSLPDILFRVDKNGRYLDVRTGNETLLAIEPDIFLGKTIREVWPEEIADFHMNYLQKGFAGKELVSYEYPAKTLDGEMKFFEARIKKINDEEAVVVCRDVTEKVKASEGLQVLNEKLTASNKDLEQFAYIISHDLREPLRMVSSFLELLQKKLGDQLDDKSKQLIHFATDGAGRMKAMIEDLLQFSRVNTNNEIHTATDLNEVMNYITRVLDETITKNQAVITVHPLPVITVNKTLITQLFINLINNALKFFGDLPPQIEVGSREDPVEWIFYVKDNGIGIDPKHFEKIFLVFQRLHEKGKYPGTGIGLAICKRVVELHKGKIWVESQPGSGTSFYFSIPKKQNV